MTLVHNIVACRNRIIKENFSYKNGYISGGAESTDRVPYRENCHLSAISLQLSTASHDLKARKTKK